MVESPELIICQENDTEQILLEDFQKICRSCLNKNGIVDLFCFVHEDSLLSDIYKTVSLLELTKTDGLPNKLCHPCANFVMQVHSFRKRAVDSEYSLKKIHIKWEQEKDVRFEVLNLKSELQNQEPCIDVKQEKIRNNKIKEIDSNIADNESCINENSSDTDLEQDNKKTVQQKKTREKRIPLKKRSSDLICSFCNSSFETYLEYKTHRLKEADRRRKKYPCSVCQKLISKYKLKDHINSHTKESPYSCNVCGEKFRFRSSLTRHNFRHKEKKPHVCHICGKGFIQAPVLTDHLRTHSGEKSFICNVCGKSFITKHSLSNHINMHKANENYLETDLTCKLCSKIFSTRSILKNHMLCTHYEKEYLCSECGKKFSTKALLDSHMKIHSGVKPFVCQICNKAFSQQNSLQKHKFVHTGEKPILCIICGKRFSQKGHLSYHMRKHSGERPYSCTYCDKTFNHTGSLKIHIRIHTGERPFVCNICSKGFYDSSSMKKHRKTHDEVKSGLITEVVSDLNIKVEKPY